MTALQALLLSLLVALSGSAAVFAHEDEQPAALGDEKLGRVEFPISCNADAQREFNRGVAILHSFYYPDAVKSFTRVTQLDAHCAMGHWGVAMSWWYPLWFPPTQEALAQGSAAVERAQASAPPTRREQDYIAAIAAFYRDADKLDHASRAAAYQRAIERVYRNYPDDHEAAAFYALALQATADPNDKRYTNQIESGAILEELYAAQPDHPGVAHYLIHAYDYPELAPKALDAARHYGQIAPSMPHALHMPSHTFIMLGLWDESIESNLQAKAAAEKIGWVQERVHTMDYLVYAYLQGGQEQAARAIVDELNSVHIAERHTLVMDYAIAAAPARFAVERRRWSEAAELATLSGSAFPASDAVAHYVRALGFARSGTPQAAAAELRKLAEIKALLFQRKQDYWAKQIDIQYQTAAAWIAWAERDRETALTAMRRAVDLEASTYKHPIMPAPLLPARELLADLLLEAGEPQQALLEYEASLALVPNRFNSLYGAAQAAQRSGDAAKADRYYAHLLSACAKADTESPELQRARQFSARH